MDPFPAGVPAHASLRVAANLLAQSPHGVLPVSDGDAYLGVISARIVADAIENAERGVSSVEELVQRCDTVRSTDSVEDAVRALHSGDLGALLVLDTTSDRIVGWFDYRCALRTLEGRAVSM